MKNKLSINNSIETYIYSRLRNKIEIFRAIGWSKFVAASMDLFLNDNTFEKKIISKIKEGENKDGKK